MVPPPILSLSFLEVRNLLDKQGFANCQAIPTKPFHMIRQLVAHATAYSRLHHTKHQNLAHAPLPVQYFSYEILPAFSGFHAGLAQLRRYAFHPKPGSSLDRQRYAWSCFGEGPGHCPAACTEKMPHGGEQQKQLLL